MKIITTIPPYAPFLKALAKHPSIHGVRLNTVMPIKESLVERLTHLKKIFGEKSIWIDLKCRQIRVSYGSFFKSPSGIKKYRINGEDVILDPSTPKAHGKLRTPPWAEIKIDRKIKLDFSDGPIQCFFSDGKDSAFLVEVVDGDRLIMLDGPQKVVGGGESINVIHPSLEIEGYLTDRDIEYIEAAKKVGIHTYMLSYVEKDEDIKSLLELDKDAIIAAKIESKKGIEWVRQSYVDTKFAESKFDAPIKLMAARGDLFVELGSKRPERVLRALETISMSDGEAILASRILSSLNNSPNPTCSDITDIACMLQYGFEYFMLGDDICFKEDALMLAIDILNAIDSEIKGL